MADIFISYASEDRSRVEPLAKALEEQGWSIFWDRTIPAGKSFDQVIQEAITAAKCVVVLWSEKSIKSDWVREEATIGKRRQILVPAKIDSVEPPLGFGMIQAADLTDWEAGTNHTELEGFLSAISDFVGPPPQREKGDQVTEIPESTIEQPSEIQPEERGIPQPIPRHPEPDEIKPSEPKPDATTTTKPRPSESRKKSKALKFGAAGVVIVLLIVGIWWWVSRQQENEARQELEKLDRQALNHENAIPELDIAGRKGKIFVESIPEKDRAESCIKEGKHYGITEGPFQGRWYHYYERGLSFAEGHCWGKAERDLRKALIQRDDGDRRREKTYGIYFIDYFPHRELGIVLFHQKRYANAILELEISLNATVTAKAEHYLDQSTKSRILSQTQDKRPPEILSRTPDQGLQTNNFALRVSGTVRDDNFVKSVRINNKPIRIDLVAPEVQYDTEVSLRNGNNTITISAADIVGNTSSLQRTVTVDRLGPVISVDEPAEGTPISSREVRLKGYVADDTNLASVLVNGREILDQQSPEFILDHPVALSPQMDRITIKAADILGNQTTAEISLSGNRASGDSSILLAGLQLILHAANRKDPGMAKIRPDEIPPEIELKDWTEEQSVYLEEVFLEFSVSDNEGVEGVSFNGSSVGFRQAKKLYFNTIVRLEVGDNIFHFKAQDSSGNISTKSINIQRNIQDIRKVGSRMELMILPFERKGEPGEIGKLLEETLLKALIKNGRFKMKRKFGPSIGKLDDTHAAARAGKNMNVNYVLAGSVSETKGSIEIYAQIIETNTSQILTTQNVYGVDIDRETLDLLCRGLVTRLHDALPVSEGIVVRVTGKKVFLDLGKESRIKEGMRCILFKEGETLVHPITGVAIGSPVVELGRAMILTVHEGYAEAEIIEVLADGIAPSDKVITQ